MGWKMEESRLSSFPTCIEICGKEECKLNEPCTQHPQMLEWLQELLSKMGKHDAHIETSLENQKEIFAQLHEIKTAIDQRTIVNVGIDKQIDKITEVANSNSSNIQRLMLVVENGLSDRTKTIESSVKALEEAMEKRRQEKELEKAVCDAGIQGFFSESWREVKKKIGPIIIYIIIGTIVWIGAKVMIFNELPFQLSRKAVVEQILNSEHVVQEDEVKEK